MRTITIVLTILLLSMLLLAGCGQSNTNGNSERSTNSDITNKEQNDVANEQQVYIDESSYEGEELELVKVLNKSIKYRNERNENEFMALISNEPDTPIKQMNLKKVINIQIDRIGDISDTTGVIQALITTENAPQSSTMYVFHKINGQWKIYDID